MLSRLKHDHKNKKEIKKNKELNEFNSRSLTPAKKVEQKYRNH